MPSIPDPAAVAARSATAPEAVPLAAEGLGFAVRRRHAWADALGQRPFGATGGAGLVDIQRRHLAFVRPMLAASGQAPEDRDTALPIVAARPVATGGATPRGRDDAVATDAGGVTGSGGASPDPGAGSGSDPGFAVAGGTSSTAGGGPTVARRGGPRPEAPAPGLPPASSAPATVARAQALPGPDRAMRVDPTGLSDPPNPSVATGAARTDAGLAGDAGSTAPVRTPPWPVARAARGDATPPMHSAATGVGPAPEVTTVRRMPAAPAASVRGSAPAVSSAGGGRPDEGTSEGTGVPEPGRPTAGTATVTAMATNAMTATAALPAASPGATPPHVQRWPQPQPQPQPHTQPQPRAQTRPVALPPTPSALLSPSTSPSPSPVTARPSATSPHVVATMPAPQSHGTPARAVPPGAAPRVDAPLALPSPWPSEHRSDRAPTSSDRRHGWHLERAALAGSAAHGSDEGAGTVAAAAVADVTATSRAALPDAAATADPAAIFVRPGMTGRPAVSRSVATAVPRAATARRDASDPPARIDTVGPVGRGPGHEVGAGTNANANANASLGTSTSTNPGTGTARSLARRQADGPLTWVAPTARPPDADVVSLAPAAPGRGPARTAGEPPASRPASMSAGDPGPASDPTASAPVAVSVTAPGPMPMHRPVAASAWRPLLSRARNPSLADPVVAPRAGAADAASSATATATAMATATAPAVARAARSESDAPPALLLAAPATVASGRHGDAPTRAPSRSRSLSPSDPDTLFRSAAEQRFGTTPSLTEMAAEPPPAPGSPFPPTAAGTATAAGAAGIDLEDLVERAVQALLHRLDIERERRGFAAWP